MQPVSSCPTVFTRCNVYCSFKVMTIYVVDTTDGRKFPILASPKTKIKKVLAALRTIGIPTDEMRLICDGIRPYDDRSLLDYNIENGDSLHLFRELCGGKPVIYLLAPEGMEASVELSLVPQWRLSTIYPVVPVKPASSHSLQKLTWRVRVHPNGDLTELTTGLDTAYLFWEATYVWFLSKHYCSPDYLYTARTRHSLVSTCNLGPIADPGIETFNPTDVVISDKNAIAICVKDITPYLDATLKALGLHTEARSSFIT